MALVCAHVHRAQNSWPLLVDHARETVLHARPLQHVCYGFRVDLPPLPGHFHGPLRSGARAAHAGALERHMENLTEPSRVQMPSPRQAMPREGTTCALEDQIK